jgi:translation initiation factor IF-1
MNNLISRVTHSRIKSEALILIVLFAALQLAGCASTVEKNANKNLFEQALVLQQVKTNSPIMNGTSNNGQLNNRHSNNNVLVNTRDKVEWEFSAQQVQPSSSQKQELFLWFSQLTNYNDNPILLQLGPDWISSYKRGNVLRSMIPRGILIQQQYDDKLPEHKVIFSLKNSNAVLAKARGRL